MHKFAYSINKSNRDDIINHLNKCAHLFSPALHSYVNIENYSEKIFKYAIRFEYWADNLLIGLVACYLNDEKKNEGFITDVSVEEEYHGKDIARTLLKNTFDEATKRGFKHLSLEVEPTNYKALNLYKHFGFYLESKKGSKNKMVARITDNKIIVSISCITYNHGRYIKDALDGFLSQKSSFKYEILIHDDASTDNTSDIIREYEKKYPDLILPIYQIENQYSKGIKISSTYNWPRARGKYIALCEGDDYWTDPLKLQKQVDFLERNEDCVICFHDVDILEVDGQIVKDYITSNRINNLNLDHITTFDLLSRGNFIHTPSVVFRNIKINYPMEMSFSKVGDYFLYVLLSKHGYIYKMNDTMAHYRNGVGIYSTIDSEEIKYSIVEYQSAILAFLSDEEGKVDLLKRQIKYINDIKLRHQELLLELKKADQITLIRIIKLLWKRMRNHLKFLFIL